MTGVYILGAGVTGLGAAYTSGLEVLEAADHPGGICSSYYMHTSGEPRAYAPPSDGEAYRFEIGGGHWIFGGEPQTLSFIESLADMRSYERRSAVFIPDRGLRIPYPIQNHLRYLSQAEAAQALQEITELASGPRAPTTMAEWIDCNFGPTLGELFFHPFHELYTASLWTKIAPQDAYKSPLDVAAVRQGASRDAAPAGYNATFRYPRSGLDGLVRALASPSRIRYGARVEAIDAEERIIALSDGSSLAYDTLITTLPLNRFMRMTGFETQAREDPYTSVLVLNIGARRGTDCPDDHWVYVPRSDAGFHRVGFYSNVDASFIPPSDRSEGSGVSIYVETAFEGGHRPRPNDVEVLTKATLTELQDWNWITDVDVVDPTWIDVAYTWSWPGSTWAPEAIAMLEARSIRPVGRYARWIFQGIADSIRDGLAEGERISADAT